MKNVFFRIFVAAALVLPCRSVFGEDAPAPAKPESHFAFLDFKDKDFDIFPVPIWTTRPDEKESYGLMPVILFSDRETKAIQTIFAVNGQYNSVKKFSGAAIYYYYPDPDGNPDEVWQGYFEFAQKYYREGSWRYTNPKLLDKFYVDAGFLWLKTPFRRFYGYGSKTPEAAESNFVSRNFNFNATFGYYFTDFFRVNFNENFITTDLLTRAIPDVADTLSTYGALPGVNDATNFVHKLSATIDTRDRGPNSKEGHFAELGVFGAVKALASDTTFAGVSLEGIHLNTMFQGKTTTAFRFFAQDMYGEGIPFYLQSSLGGDKEFRSYIPNRFIDTGKVLFTWEQRFRVIAREVFGIPCEFWMDPFVEVGGVFRHLSDIGQSKFRGDGGLGLRFVVPPNVVARIDIAAGDEGYNVYTQLNYPF